MFTIGLWFQNSFGRINLDLVTFIVILSIVKYYPAVADGFSRLCGSESCKKSLWICMIKVLLVSLTVLNSSFCHAFSITVMDYSYILITGHKHNGSCYPFYFYDGSLANRLYASIDFDVEWPSATSIDHLTDP